MSNALFDRFDNVDVRDMIAEFPLAWVCPAAGPSDECALLPLLGEYDATGRLTHIFGHMSRSNPLLNRLTSDARATFLFQGPQAYVSPEHAGRRNWAPTWNYAQIRISGHVTFVPDETLAAVEQLTAWMEAGRPEPWGVDEIGSRLQPMLQRIIAFRAEVTNLTGRFKLAQDEDLETLQAILGATSDAKMQDWVERFNKDRLS